MLYTVHFKLVTKLVDEKSMLIYEPYMVYSRTAWIGQILLTYISQRAMFSLRHFFSWDACTSWYRLCMRRVASLLLLLTSVKASFLISVQSNLAALLPNSHEILRISWSRDKLDVFYSTYMVRNVSLTLSQGIASVVSVILVNADVLVQNLHELLAAQRIVYDGVQ